MYSEFIYIYTPSLPNIFTDAIFLWILFILAMIHFDTIIWSRETLSNWFLCSICLNRWLRSLLITLLIWMAFFKRISDTVLNNPIPSHHLVQQVTQRPDLCFITIVLQHIQLEIIPKSVKFTIFNIQMLPFLSMSMTYTNIPWIRLYYD